MRASTSSRLVTHIVYASLGILSVLFLLNNIFHTSVTVRLSRSVRYHSDGLLCSMAKLRCTEEVQRSDAYQISQPIQSKATLLSRIKDLEEQLQAAHQAVHSAVSGSQDANVQRSSSITHVKQHVQDVTDVTEALSLVSVSVDSADVSDVPQTNATHVDSSSGLEGMPPQATVFVTFVNGDEKYREMMLNWALHLRAIQVWHVVVAFDDKAAATCAEQGIPFIRYASCCLRQFLLFEPRFRYCCAPCLLSGLFKSRICRSTLHRQTCLDALAGTAVAQSTLQRAQIPLRIFSTLCRAIAYIPALSAHTIATGQS